MKNEFKNSLGEVNCVVDFDLDAKIPFFTWYGFVDLEVIQEACEDMLTLVEATKATVYLSDNRHATGYSDQLPDWTSAHFVPKLRALGIKHYATVPPQKLITSTPLQEFEENLAHSFQAKSFRSPEEAKAWLTSAQ